MSGRTLSLDAEQIGDLQVRVAAYGDGAEDAVNDVLHREAGPIIYEEINPLIHPSGRTFRGHTSSATRARWPRYVTDENLAVTVGTTSKWRYLYFPDDGGNTKRHAGGQHFFLRGATAAVPEVLKRCLAALTQEWEQ